LVVVDFVAAAGGGVAGAAGELVEGVVGGGVCDWARAAVTGATARAVSRQSVAISVGVMGLVMGEALGLGW
jgi:hypothetical protein